MVISDIMQIGVIVEWGDTNNLVHIGDTMYKNVPYLKRYDEDYQAGNMVLLFKYFDGYLIYSTLANMTRFMLEVKSSGIQPNAPKWAECTCEIVVEHEEQLHTEYVRDENCPKHGITCAPGCDYPVTGYHARRGGKTLCRT